MARQTHRQINSIGNPRTTDKHVHARGRRGEIQHRMCRGGAANALVQVGELTPEDELLQVMNIERTAAAPTADGSDEPDDIAGDFSVVPLFEIDSVEVTDPGDGYDDVADAAITIVRPGAGNARPVEITAGALTSVLGTGADDSDKVASVMVTTRGVYALGPSDARSNRQDDEFLTGVLTLTFAASSGTAPNVTATGIVKLRRTGVARIRRTSGLANRNLLVTYRQDRDLP